MSRPQVLLALQMQFADHDVEPAQGLRVWVKLAAGKTEDDLLHSTKPWRVVVGCFLTGWVTTEELRWLVESDAVEDLDLAEPLLLERRPVRQPVRAGEASPAQEKLPAGARAPQGTSPVLGIIDTGLPFVHQGVLRPHDPRRGPRQGTRFIALWDQDPEPDFGSLGRIPSRLGFGAVLDRKSIDAQQLEAGGDEALTYQLTGYGAVQARRTHGAHVLGLLAMGEPDVDAALGLGGTAYRQTLAADIVAVQLPRALLDSPSRGALCSAVLDGLLWMRDVCGKRALRVVVPYGSTLGPHDGSSLFERALDAIVQAAEGRLQVFLPVGNSHRMNLHALLAKGTGAGAHTLRWRMPLASEACSFVEIWAPAGLVQRVDVVSPDGRRRTSLQTSRSEARVASADGAGGAMVAHAAMPAHDGVAQGKQHCVLIRFPPTQVCSSARQAGASGDWLIQVHIDSKLTGEVHAFGSRGRGSFGSVIRARQGRFVTPAASAWTLCCEGTISGMATGARVRVVGAYVNGITRASVMAAAKAKKLAGKAGSAGRAGEAAVAGRAAAAVKAKASTYSSSGPARNGRKVDESFAGDESSALPGVRSTGTRSAISWRMDGSSVAAPQAARVRERSGNDASKSPVPVEDELRLGKVQVPGLVLAPAPGSVNSRAGGRAVTTAHAKRSKSKVRKA